MRINIELNLSLDITYNLTLLWFKDYIYDLSFLRVSNDSINGQVCSCYLYPIVFMRFRIKFSVDLIALV